MTLTTAEEDRIREIVREEIAAGAQKPKMHAFAFLGCERPWCGECNESYESPFHYGADSHVHTLGASVVET